MKRINSLAILGCSLIVSLSFALKSMEPIRVNFVVENRTSIPVTVEVFSDTDSFKTKELPAMDFEAGKWSSDGAMLEGTKLTQIRINGVNLPEADGIQLITPRGTNRSRMINDYRLTLLSGSRPPYHLGRLAYRISADLFVGSAERALFLKK